MGTEMKGSLLKKEVAYGIIVLFLITSIAPVISGSITENDQPIDDVLNSPVVTKKTMILTFYVFGKTTIEKHDVEIAIDDASAISEMFEQLKHEMATYPSSEKTQRLQQEFCTILKEKGVIPKEMSQEELMSLMQPPVIPERHRQGALLPLQNRASE
jgi:hypothetical protein